MRTDMPEWERKMIQSQERAEPIWFGPASEKPGKPIWFGPAKDDPTGLANIFIGCAGD